MSESDFGVWISAPGNSVIGASPGDLVMDTSNPFLKIDTQSPNGFVTLNLLINTDPPEPVGPSWNNTYTIVAKLAHGYPYIPAVEMLCYVSSPPPGSTGTMTYFQDYGRIGAHTFADGADLYAIADATYIYFVVEKFNDGSGSTNLLSGTNLLLSIHTFVEDLLSQQ